MRYCLLLSILFLYACGPTPYYAELQELENESWPTTEVLSFETAVEDIDAKYDLHLIVAHDDSYNYENIYLKILTKFPNEKQKEEQLSIDLADRKGVWVGNCSGATCKCKVYLLENFKFPEQGAYTFEIKQYTRDENLEGINSLELQLFKKEEETN